MTPPPTIHEMEVMLGREFMDHQWDALEDAQQQHRNGLLRMCLYHRTGGGKTITSLAAIRLTGETRVLVVAPPVTHGQWVEQGNQLGMHVDTISHNIFREKKTRLHRDRALIVDEFHLLGGHTGKGWTRLDGAARGLQAPLVICSATPNYNDVERVYCIQHVLAPHTCKGGFLQFIYDHCITEYNPYGSTPKVTGFRNFRDAEAYLKDLPYVHYLEDEAIKQVTIGDVDVQVPAPPLLLRWGLDHRRKRLCASRMERDHALVRHTILDEDDLVRREVYEEIALQVGQANTPTLIYAAHAEIARALQKTCEAHGANTLLVTGDTPKAEKLRTVAAFKEGGFDALIGTATLATGTDGIDQMCNHLLIIDDTNDNAHRRQLMGRILPRGLDSDTTEKVFTRLVYVM